MASAACVCLAACKGTGEEMSLVAGTLDGPLPADTMPARAYEAMQQADRFHQYDIMSDTVNDVSVFSIAEVDTVPTGGYGIVVSKGPMSTTFPHIRNARQPKTRYDREADVLWLTSSAMEGTGVQVERLYQIGFHDNGLAYVAHIVDPYDLQQQLCQRLGYRIDGQQLTLFDGQRLVATATNTVEDMGGFDDEHPLWIGEQMRYDLSGQSPCLLVTPGVKFNTGLMLIYNDTPTLSVPLTVTPDGRVELGEINTLNTHN